MLPNACPILAAQQFEIRELPFQLWPLPCRGCGDCPAVALMLLAAQQPSYERAALQL